MLKTIFWPLDFTDSIYTKNSYSSKTWILLENRSLLATEKSLSHPVLMLDQKPILINSRVGPAPGFDET